MSIKIMCSEPLVSVKEIKLHPDNDKIHTKAKIKNLAENIKVHGWDQPIVANIDDKTITKGNGRYQAALYLGMEKVPVVFKKYESKEIQLADLKADNESALFEYALDKEKTKRIVGLTPEHLKKITIPDYSKIADIMRYDNPITHTPQHQIVNQSESIRPAQSNQPILSTIADAASSLHNSESDENFEFEPSKDEKPVDRIHYKNLIIRLEAGIHDEVRKKLDAYFRENNIPALFL